MKHLTLSDEILLVSVMCLGDDAYSATIIKEVQKRSGKKITVGSLWVSMNGLVDRGLVRKAAVPSTSGLGGRPRAYYQLSPKGTRALRRARELKERIWRDVPELG